MAQRRTERHEHTRQQILEAAWSLARERGLTGWSLRDLASAVGMRAPSLYVYFAGKDAIYDAMFAQGYRQLLDEVDLQPSAQDPIEAVHRMARFFVEFCVADPARMTLLFLRVIPSFVPSAESWQLAVEAYERGGAQLAAAGITRPESLDIWTALLSGLATQQVSNDPGGERWKRLVDRAVDMFVAAELHAANHAASR